MSSETKGFIAFCICVCIAVLAIVAGMTWVNERYWEKRNVVDRIAIEQEANLRKACIESGGTVIDVNRAAHHCLSTRQDAKNPPK